MTSDISCSSPRKEAYSASVKDVLGENSSVLGWALAVGGGAAGLGICGVAGPGGQGGQGSRGCGMGKHAGGVS